MARSLTNELRTYCCIAASTALHRDKDTAMSIKRAIRSGFSLLKVKEVILQNYLFCGFPTAIEGLIQLQAVVKKMNVVDKNYEERRDSVAIVSDGERLCRTVYGDHYEKLIANMRALSPDLHQWMIAEGYGKVLSRPVLNPVERELCVIVVLAALGRERQFRSHIHGALHVGASEALVHQAIRVLRPMVPKSRYRNAENLIQNVLKS